MIGFVDLQRVRAAVWLLNQCEPENRFLQLKNLCVDNDGIWPVPEDPTRYNPAWYEVQLFGVSAMAEDPKDLHKNWLKAAGNVLRNLPSLTDAA